MQYTHPLLLCFSLLQEGSFVLEFKCRNGRDRFSGGSHRILFRILFCNYIPRDKTRDDAKLEKITK